MKVEIEIDDRIHARLIEIFGDERVLREFFAGIMEGMVILMASHPEEFKAVYADHDTGEAKDFVDDHVDKLVSRVLTKARAEKVGE